VLDRHWLHGKTNISDYLRKYFEIHAFIVRVLVMVFGVVGGYSTLVYFMSRLMKNMSYKSHTITDMLVTYIGVLKNF